MKYSEVTLALPNIKVLWPVDREKAAEFDMSKEMKPLIMQAARKFPAWTFCSSLAHSVSNVEGTYRHFVDFNIYASNNEKLGSVNFTINNKREVVYVLENDRINGIRERGRGAKTKDLDKALKLMDKFYGNKTKLELISECMSAAGRMLPHIQHRAERQFDGQYARVGHLMTKYVMDNWEQCKEIVTRYGATEKDLENVPEAYAEYSIADKIYKSWEDKKGHIIMLNGSDYVVYDWVNSQLTVREAGGIPEWMRRGIGLLKLVEPELCLRDVGYKISETAFYLIPQEEPSNE
jgi:hypothetical protein